MNPEFIGVLEAPLGHAPLILGEPFLVAGWAMLPRNVGVDAVSVCAPGQAQRALEFGLSRTDVGEAFPAVAASWRCGFRGWLPTSGLSAGEQPIEVTAWAAGQAAYRWRRLVRLVGADDAYRVWRQRAMAGLKEPADSRSDSRILWVVICDAADRREAVAATLDSLLKQRVPALVLPVEADLAAHLPQACRHVGVLRAGDRLAEGGARLIEDHLDVRPEIDFLYCDHDHALDEERCGDPVLKPGFSRLLGEHPDVLGGAWVARTSSLMGASSEAGEPGTADGDAKVSGWATQALRSVRVVGHLAAPLFTLGARRERPRKPPPCLQVPPEATVVIATRVADREMLTQCLDSLRFGTDGVDLQIVVALNNLGEVTQAEARDFLRPWQVDAIHVDGPFNWSRINNAGARAARHEHLLFLNDDIRALARDWLQRMLACAERTGAGVVGALLRYPDGTIQHGGVSIHNRLGLDCRHLFRHAHGHEPRVRRWLLQDRTQTAVTGACLLTQRKRFLALGGFDESLAVTFNDIDYCLRVGQSGSSCIVAAGAELLHYEGYSRGGINEQTDRERFLQRWGADLPADDPFLNPALDHRSDDWQFATEHGSIDLLWRLRTFRP